MPGFLWFWMFMLFYVTFINFCKRERFTKFFHQKIYEDRNVLYTLVKTSTSPRMCCYTIACESWGTISTAVTAHTANCCPIPVFVILLYQLLWVICKKYLFLFYFCYVTERLLTKIMCMYQRPQRRNFTTVNAFCSLHTWHIVVFVCKRCLKVLKLYFRVYKLRLSPSHCDVSMLFICD